jgi:hypothetical protein
MSINVTLRPGADDMAPNKLGLPAPYKFRMSLKRAQSVIEGCKNVASRLSQQDGRKFLQFDHVVRTKPVKYGVRFHVWALALKIKDFGPDRGCTREEWDAFVAGMTEFLKKRFPGCKPYAEKWNEETKPQFSFETYIRYAEFR